MLAIPAMAAGIMAASAGPASASDGDLVTIVQEVTGTVIHAEDGLTDAAGNVTGIAESIVFELGQTIRAILAPDQP